MKKHSDMYLFNSLSFILAFIFTSAAAATGLGWWLGSCCRLLDIPAHLECQMVEICEEARSHVLILFSDLISVCFALICDLQHDETVRIAELDFWARHCWVFFVQIATFVQILVEIGKLHLWFVQRSGITSLLLVLSGCCSFHHLLLKNIYLKIIIN